VDISYFRHAHQLNIELGQTVLLIIRTLGGRAQPIRGHARESSRCAMSLPYFRSRAVRLLREERKVAGVSMSSPVRQ
jgi:hypothetical protein